jgi:hypothetical protein
MAYLKYMKVLQLLFESGKTHRLEVDVVDSDLALAEHFTEDVAFFYDKYFFQPLKILNL